MEKPVAGDVVIISFPHTDLSLAKRRPSLVLADLKGDDLILCQITSKAKSDGYSIPVSSPDFFAGGLPIDSYVRPNRLFTASMSIVLRVAGHIRQDKLDSILDATIALLRASMKKGSHA